MLKELVASIFCCLPHHHEAPAPVVAERITPITVVSEEPYSQEAYRDALQHRRYEDVCKIKCKRCIELYGSDLFEVLKVIDDNCEMFARDRMYLRDRLSISCSDYIQAACRHIRPYSTSDIDVSKILYFHARETRSAGDILKAFYWCLLMEELGVIRNSELISLSSIVGGV